VAGFIEQQFGIQRPLAWLDRLGALVARELAPSPRKIRTALRVSMIVTLACWTGRELSRQQSAGRGNCLAPGWRRADDVHSQGPGMADRGDARSNHVGGDGARICGDAVVDAAVCLRMDFIFNLRGNDAQARRGRARYIDSMPHYILRRGIFT
jgi:hypothetical protein